MRFSEPFKCHNCRVGISLDTKFIAPTRLNDEIIGKVSVEKKTNSLVFLNCLLKSKNKIVALSSVIWKILNYKITDEGYGG